MFRNTLNYSDLHNYVLTIRSEVAFVQSESSTLYIDKRFVVRDFKASGHSQMHLIKVT